MRAGIRLTTCAELADLESPPQYRQLAAAEKVARKLFPVGKRRDSQPWKGARPCMPDIDLVGLASTDNCLIVHLERGEPTLLEGRPAASNSRTSKHWHTRCGSSYPTSYPRARARRTYTRGIDAALPLQTLKR